MRFNVKFTTAAAIMTALLAAPALAQTQAGGDSAAMPANDGAWQVVTGSAYQQAGVMPGTDATPAWLSDGTLAESANTTALASSTYHQPTGFLPGMKP